MTRNEMLTALYSVANEIATHKLSEEEVYKKLNYDIFATAENWNKTHNQKEKISINDIFDKDGDFVGFSINSAVWHLPKYLLG